MLKIKLADEQTMQARYVALWWDAISVPEQHNINLKNLVKRAPKAPGVYAITGHHDTRPGQSILYIGKADKISDRLPISITDTLCEIHANGQSALYSDVWDLTIRWARLANRNGLHLAVETLLILSHSPPFNSQGVRRLALDRKHHDLIVMNAGRKGPLMPVVAGAYQTTWQDANGRLLGP